MIWDYVNEIANSTKITIESATFKLLLSLVAGGLVGLNRERHNQAAGFRTHILICVGSTLLMIISIYIPQVYFDFKNGDPGRIAAQVVSGIGFLGAGAIIRLGTNIRGLTTAASIWLISAIGLCIGAGLYIIALVTVIIVLFTLIFLERIESRWFPQSHYKTIEISFNSNYVPENELKGIFKHDKIIVRDYSISIQNHSGKFCEIKMNVKIPKNIEISGIMENLNSLPAVHTIKIS
jgi:putative Mg2+ transporter-C (MgtC) family protein